MRLSVSRTRSVMAWMRFFDEICVSFCVSFHPSSPHAPIVSERRVHPTELHAMGAPRSPRSPHIVSSRGNNFLLVVKQHQEEAMAPKTACASKTVVSLGLRTHAMFRAYAGHPSKFTIIARDDEGHVMTRGGA